MGLQVRGGSTILRVLITANPTTLDFAASGSALEEMEDSIPLSADLDIALEETIDRRAPDFLQAFCTTSRSVTGIGTSKKLRTYQVLPQVFHQRICLRLRLQSR